MTEGDGRWQSTCNGKKRLIATIARSIVQRHKKSGRTSSAYKCRYCGMWHVETGGAAGPKDRRK